METRRVQVTGGSSYIVTLPKSWVKSAGIKKNDPVGVITNPDGTLFITPNVAERRSERIKEFDIESVDEPSYLFRCLIGSYISGYTAVRIKSAKRMPPFAGTVVRKFTRATIGQEVVEETDRVITIKDLLDPAEMPFSKTIERMNTLVKNMHEDVITALGKGDKKLAEDVIVRDTEVNRLHWLIARQHNMISKRVRFSEKMNLDLTTAANYLLISRIIERIGDHAVRMAKNILSLINKRVDKKIIDHIKSASDLSISIFSKSMESFFKRDLRSSNENIESVQRLESQCESINNLALQQKGGTAMAIGYIVESIRRTGEYSRDICENVINYLVGQEKVSA